MPKIIEDSLCWNCKNACGKCSWSQELKPVDKWVAEKNNWSYKVIECPYFEEFNKKRYKRITVENVAKMLKTNTTMVSELCDDYIIHKLNSLGYNILIDSRGKKRAYFLFS